MSSKGTIQMSRPRPWAAKRYDTTVRGMENAVATRPTQSSVCHEAARPVSERAHTRHRKKRTASTPKSGVITLRPMDSSVTGQSHVVASNFSVVRASLVEQLDATHNDICAVRAALVQIHEMLVATWHADVGKYSTRHSSAHTGILVALSNMCSWNREIADSIFGMQWNQNGRQ